MYTPQKYPRPHKYSPHAVSTSFSTLQTASQFYKGKKRKHSPSDNKEGDEQAHHEEEGEEGDVGHDGHHLARLLQGGQATGVVGHQAWAGSLQAAGQGPAGSMVVTYVCHPVSR